jgi:hypothetical protein
MQLIQILYHPRVEDTVVVATFGDAVEAQKHMDEIKQKRPKAYKHHTMVISEITQHTEWPWADSGIEGGL